VSSALELQSLARETKSRATLSPLAGKPAHREMRVGLARLEHEYFAGLPDLGDRSQMVSFGTSGQRGSSFHGRKYKICPIKHRQ
jgi:hypothetical protein